MAGLKRRIGVEGEEIFIAQSESGMVHLMAWEDQPFDQDDGYQSACGKFKSDELEEVKPDFLSKFSEGTVCHQCRNSDVGRKELEGVE